MNVKREYLLNTMKTALKILKGISKNNISHHFWKENERNEEYKQRQIWLAEMDSQAYTEAWKGKTELKKKKEYCINTDKMHDLWK